MLILDIGGEPDLDQDLGARARFRSDRVGDSRHNFRLDICKGRCWIRIRADAATQDLTEDIRRIGKLMAGRIRAPARPPPPVHGPDDELEAYRQYEFDHPDTYPM